MNPAPRIRTVAETRSTNADMAALAKEGAGEGEWIVAERQTGGRGRLGREWVSPAGNLYCSTLVRLRPGDSPTHSLAFVAGLALHDAVEAMHPKGKPMLKWPNDLLLDGAKCAGILLEREGTSDAVVIGFGVNLASAPDLPDRATASLSQHGVETSPALLVAALAEHIAARLSHWRGQPLGVLLDDWTANAHPIGAPLTVSSGEQRQSGTFAGLSDDGALLLRLPEGGIATINAGDVSLVASEG